MKQDPSLTLPGRLGRMRDIVQEDVGGRGLATDPAENLVTACAGDFETACRSIAETAAPSLAIVTGFFIPTSEPPAGETDGPLGAVFLARALVPLGVRVVIATDAFCGRAVEAGLGTCGLRKSVPIVILPGFAECRAMTAGAYADRFRERAGSLTHLLAIERVGPNYHPQLGRVPGGYASEVPEASWDRCHTMRGRDITESMSPAHWLFEEARGEGVTTIGIGDGGNEIGMGKIAWQTIRRNIARGGLVGCRVATDHLIVAGTSNWGAYGLAAGVLAVRGARAAPELFDSEREREILQIMVESGPLVDGVVGKQSATVDGLDFERYGAVLGKLGVLVHEA